MSDISKLSRSDEKTSTGPISSNLVADEVEEASLGRSVPMNESAERKLLWKLDAHVLPTISLLYMLSFIDRINIGNARIQGLEADLHIVGNDYNIALQIFFLPYILLEVPSNIVLKRIAPSTWLSAIMFFWGTSDGSFGFARQSKSDMLLGIIPVCMGLTKSYAGLVACSFLLGVFEAGFVPGRLIVFQQSGQDVKCLL